jgi:NAD+ synthase (glutamine-hydrolysing)
VEQGVFAIEICKRAAAITGTDFQEISAYNLVLMKIALAQINPLVGDITGNLRRIKDKIKIASTKRCDLVVFSELSLTGYPPRDLVENSHFVMRNRNAVEQLARETGALGVIIGFVDLNPKPFGRRLANAAALLHRGRIAAIRHKTLLPTYDVFDELRHFEPARANAPVSFKGRRLGITICEDMWNAPGFVPEGLYGRVDPVARLARDGAEILINLSSSPFHRNKSGLRRKLVLHHVQKNKRPFVFVNQVGGNDELFFDGISFALVV